MQGRPKGGKNKYYSKEEKLKYVEQMLNGRSCWEIEREEGISHSITNKWLNKYNEQGIKGLENQKKPGNPLCKSTVNCSCVIPASFLNFLILSEITNI